MLEVEKFKNYNGYDVIIIKTNEGAFEISFEGNLDLYMRYISDGSILKDKKSHTLTITKENYFVYELFNKLYNSIKSGKVYYNLECNDYINADDETKKRLFKNNIIDYHSDDSTYEDSSRLIIEKIEDAFNIKFVKGISNGTFLTYSVRISNSGGRYEPFNIAFMNMYRGLKMYDPSDLQMTLEQCAYNQKILSKKK